MHRAKVQMIVPPGVERLAPAGRAQLDLAVADIRAHLGDDLLGLYLHGSAVADGLRLHSDIDLLAVVAGPLSRAQRTGLERSLLARSAPHPAPAGGPRSLELMVVARDDLALRPERAQFVYGEWLRAAIAMHGTSAVVDEEHVLILAQARHASALCGAPLHTMMDPVPVPRVRAAMASVLPSLLRTLKTDTRNVLLTLSRMWYTACTGAFIGKHRAAEWAAARVCAPDAAVLIAARDAYLGSRSTWLDARPRAVRDAAQNLRRNVEQSLAEASEPSAG